MLMEAPANSADSAVVARAVTAMMGVIIGLTFLFGLGNVLALALRLGVPVYVAPLVAPAVDLSVLGLLLGLRHLLLSGVPRDQLRPIRRLLLFASSATLALNVADPLLGGNFGRAAFDSVGPWLLIGWAEVGPGLLQAMRAADAERSTERARPSGPATAAQPLRAAGAVAKPTSPAAFDDELIRKAQWVNDRHWIQCLRPASAETLRKELRIGAARARSLRSLVRALPPTPAAQQAAGDDELRWSTEGSA